jgi:hypothetical protein
MSTFCISRRRLILGSALALSLTGVARAGDLIGPVDVAGQPDLETAPEVMVPSRPSVEFVAVRASRLRLGMTATEVTAAMGQATKTADYCNADVGLQTLDFSAEPIRSKVTLTNGRVSHVVLDVFRVDQDDLPTFTHVAWPGLNSGTVLGLLGKPNDTRHHALFDIKVDQLIFRRAGEPDVSLFFVTDRLVAKRVGQDIPVDIFRVNLPLPPDVTDEESLEGFVRVGMKASDVKMLYGAPRLEVAYTFNGHAAEHVIYQTQPEGSFVSLTFVSDVVTEFSDIGLLPDDNIFAGR